MRADSQANTGNHKSNKSQKLTPCRGTWKQGKTELLINIKSEMSKNHRLTQNLWEDDPRDCSRGGTQDKCFQIVKDIATFEEEKIHLKRSNGGLAARVKANISQSATQADRSWENNVSPCSTQPTPTW